LRGIKKETNGGGNMSFSDFCYSYAGLPENEIKFEIENIEKLCCATCGEEKKRGTKRKNIDIKTFSNHFNDMKYSHDYVCEPCAWLFSAGRSKPGNFLASPLGFVKTVISHDSVVEDKIPWLDHLSEVAKLPVDSVTGGVLTTDVKVRLWTRSRLVTVGSFGLYVHCPDWNISKFFSFDIQACLKASRFISEEILTKGFSKASALRGLANDFNRFSADFLRNSELEKHLIEMRSENFFIPSLIISGVKK
jgi:hypothetical protein